MTGSQNHGKYTLCEKKTGKFYALILVDYLRSGEVKRGRRKKKGEEGRKRGQKGREILPTELAGTGLEPGIGNSV